MRGLALLLLGLLGLCLAGLWVYLRREARPQPTPSPEAAAQPLLVPGEQLIETRPPGSSGSARGALDPQQAAAAFSFDGQGTIRGHVGERSGAVFPLEWDLVLEPHPYLDGRERADTRRVQLRAGEREFKVEGLHLGGYRVRAEAHGLNSSAADVLLVKGSPDQFVELALSPAGWLDGSVVDAQDAPAEGILVRLAETTTHARVEALTDAAGAYQVRSLLDGDYELSFRSGGCAFGEPRLVSFRAPRLSMPVEHLPPTGALEVHVFDLLGKPAPGVRVTGYRKPEGALDLRTDAEGIARLRWLRPGTWTIQALDEAEKLSARGEAEVELSALAQLPLRLAR